MLEQVLDFIHNYFVREEHKGDFVISGGSINLDFLQNGQYFKIVGSVFNDGVYQYPTDKLTDESFTGKVLAMAVPKQVLLLAAEIEDWVTKYGSAANSPYQSESFGGYSYSRGSTTGGRIGGGWQDVFGTRLNAWRKIS